jgi:hypothetical protein
MLVFVSPAFASDPPPAPEVTAVAFDRKGAHVAIETRWVESGSGFPNARIELWDPATGTRTGTWDARLTEERAAGGVAGASAEARAAAGAALVGAGVDLAKPAAALPCSGGVCAPAAPKGCAGRAHLTVTVTSTPTSEKVDQCYGRGTPDRLTLVVDGHTWVDESTPADGCPSAYTARTAWRKGGSVVVVLSYEVPGYEGLEERLLTRAGSIR